ncbi:MAG: flagellar protein FlgN [Leptospira sp.]|nr:flagellar protein FlgN [Leptospira sp.]
MTDQKYFQKKTELLTKLIHNLKMEEELLLNGDPDHALQWEEENQKVLEKLIQLDKKKEEMPEDSLPFQEKEILLTSQVYELLEQAREIQERVQPLLEKELKIAKDELNEVSIRRQLRIQLTNPEGLYWKKRIC